MTRAHTSKGVGIGTVTLGLYRCINNSGNNHGITHITSDNSKNRKRATTTEMDLKWVARAVVSPAGLHRVLVRAPFSVERGLKAGLGCACSLAGSVSGCGDDGQVDLVAAEAVTSLFLRARRFFTKGMAYKHSSW